MTTTTMRFNLLDDPWILVLTLDGREEELSILDTLERAPELVTIGGEVPTQGFAITRLLLAFLHRAVDGPDDQDEWSELWRADTLPMDSVRTYADRVRHRFELFDPERPFFQVAGLRTAKGEASGLEKIVADVPNGIPLFTTRSRRSLDAIAPSEAARWIVHVHAFDPSGIKSGAVGDTKVKGGKGAPIGTGWSGQLAGVFPEGPDLRSTLILNLVARDIGEYVTIGGPADVPPWERDPDGPSREDARHVPGAISLYTWQTRRVRLIAEGGAVSGVVLANGDKMQPHNRHTLEPHTAWRYSKPQTQKAKSTVYMPQMLDPDRATWRGLEAFLPATSGRHQSGSEPQSFLAPGVLQWLSDLVQDGHLPQSFVIRTRTIGATYGAQSATFNEIVDDRFPVAVAVLREDEPALGRTAQEAVQDAEAVAGELWKLAENLAAAAGAEPKSGAGDESRAHFYATLETHYRAWLARLGPSTDRHQARAIWQQVLRRTSVPIADELVRAAPPSAWTGRSVNGRTVTVPQADAWFRRGLHRVAPLPDSTIKPTAQGAAQ